MAVFNSKSMPKTLNAPTTVQPILRGVYAKNRTTDVTPTNSEKQKLTGKGLRVAIIPIQQTGESKCQHTAHYRKLEK